MKKLALIAFASAASLGLAACGSSDDASEDAMADNVERMSDVIAAIGSIGYIALGWPIGDAVYMTMELLTGRSLESIVRGARGKATSIHADAGGLDDLAPALDVLLEELRELRRRAGHAAAPELQKIAAEARALEDRIERSAEKSGVEILLVNNKLSDFFNDLSALENLNLN